MKGGEEMPGANPFDDLKDAVSVCLDIAPTKTVQVFSRVLAEQGIRGVFVALGDPLGAYPQVEITASVDDVSATVVAQVVTPILRQAGVPDEVVATLAGAAGAATVRFIERYRQHQAERAARSARVAEAARAAQDFRVRHAVHMARGSKGARGTQEGAGPGQRGREPKWNPADWFSGRGGQGRDRGDSE